MSVEDDLQQRLRALADSDLLRAPEAFVALEGGRMQTPDATLMSFCSNDYLGLSSHPALRAAVARGLELEGTLGSAASPLITGTRPIHRRAEAALAEHVGKESALLFSSGYAANVGALSSVLGRGDVAFSDSLNHASLIDGLRLSRAEVHIFRHADVGHLQELLEKHRGGRRAWLVTESLFSMDGDEAPLRDLRGLATRHDAGLFLDEAHAIGVMGTGRGLAFEHDVRADVVVGTLGKALGSSGAFAAGSKALRSVLTNRARSHVFSTAPPPALLHAVEPALALVRDGGALRARVRAHAARIRSALVESGQRTVPGDGPIVPLLLGSAQAAVSRSAALRARGLLVSAIRPPTVPEGTSRLRIVPSASHRDEDVDRLIDALKETA